MHGVKNVVDFSFVAHCFRVFGRDVSGACDDFITNSIKDTDATIAVHEIDHLVSGCFQKFGMVKHNMGAFGSANKFRLAPKAAIGEINPWTRGVNNDPWPHFAGFTGNLVS